MSVLSNHLKIHKKLLNVPGAWPLDLFQTPANVVWVVPEVAEIVGQRYKSWSKADTYVQEQNPTSTNRWAIIIGGDNAENIIVKSYTTIVGISLTTRLIGNITSNVTFTGSNFEEALIANCVCTNVTIGTSGKFVMMQDCNLAGGIITADALIFTAGFSLITGGTWTGATAVRALGVTSVFGGTFDSSFGGTFAAISGGTLAGGVFENCKITVALGDGNYGIFGGYLTKDLTLSSGSSTADIYGTEIVAAVAPVITASSGDIVNFYGVPGNFTTAGAGTFNFTADRSS